jgi:hypothetical protein
MQMKRKTVLRLLAVAMAASLATTSIPGTTLTRSEIVYADDLAQGVKAASYNSITVEAVNGSQYLAVAADSVTGTPTKDTVGWVPATGDEDSGYTAVLPNLTPGTSYTIYTLTGETVGQQTITQSTRKVNLSTDLSYGDFTLSQDTFVYDGTAKEPTVETITVGGVTLTSGTDYDVTYSGNTNVLGSHMVTVTAKDDSTKCENSTGKTFTISAASIADATVTLNTKDVDEGYSVTYDGTAKQNPTVAVTVGGRTLSSGTDFYASFSGDKTKAGTISVTIEGMGNYAGEVKAENIPAYIITKDTSTTAPTISQDTLEDNTDTSVKIKIEGSKTGYTYEYAILTTEQVKAGVEPTYAKTVEGTGSDATFTLTDLTAATDYTVYCRVKNTDDHAASDATTLAVTTATAKAANIESFTDTQIVMNNATDNTQYIATKDTTKPSEEGQGWVTAANSKATFDNLEPGTTYHIFKKGEDNEVASQATERASLSTATVKIVDGSEEKASGAYSVEYTGSEQKPTVKVTTAGDKELTLNKDYTVTYENNTNVGTDATVIVTGIGQYKDSPSSEFTFSITTASIETATVTVGGKNYDEGYSVTYDGTEKQDPEVTVTLNGTPLTSGTDFTASFSGDKTNKGELTVTISGTGNYTGTPSSIPTYKITEDTNPTVPTLSQGLVTSGNEDTKVKVIITNAKAGYNYEYAYLTAAEVAASADPNYGETSVAGSAEETSFTIDNLTPATDYTIYCRVKASNNNSVSEEKTLAVKTAAEVLQANKVELSKTTDVYNGAENAPTVTVKNSGNSTITNDEENTYYTVTYYKQDENGDNGAEVSAPKAAGTYNVVITGDGTNYSGEIKKTYTITQKTVTAKATEVKDKDYDGNTSVKVTAEFDSGMILGNDEVTIPELTGTLESANAGEGIKLLSVTSTDVVLEGADAGNYTLGTVAPNDKTATITKQSNVTFSGKDSYPVAVGQTITLDTTNNVGATMTYTLVDSNGATVEDTSVTDAITVGTTAGTVELKSYLSRTDLQIKVEISDDGGNNYDATGKSKLISLSFAKQAPYIKIGATDNWNSDAKKLVISKNDANETTFKTKLAATLNYKKDDKTPQSEGVLDKTLTYTYNGGATFPTEEGTYTVVIAYTPEGDDADNIEAASETITLVIAGEQKALSIKVADKSYTVGGTVPTYTFSATAGGSSVSLTTVPTYKICKTGTTEEVQLNSSTATGTYDIVATFTLDATDAALYTLDAQDVTAGTLTVSAASTYNPSSSNNNSNSSTGTATTYTVKENTDGSKMVVDENGKVVTDSKVTATDGKSYVTDKDGKVVTDSKVTTADGKTYITDEDGVVKTGKVAFEGKQYITGSDGAILTDQVAETPSGNKVYVDENGAIVKDKTITGSDGKRYLATKSGKLATDGFYFTPSGNKVYATASGALKTGKVFTVHGKKYYAKASGAIAAAGFVKTESGNTVYATKSGVLKVNKAFKASNGKKYVADKNGKIVKGKKITIGNKIYTTNKKGVIIKVTTKK